MNHVLLTLKLRTKRDVVRARQRARQIAQLLGYEALEQNWIAASVFEMARNGLPIRAVLRMQLQPDLLRIALTQSRGSEKDGGRQRRVGTAQIVLRLPENTSSLDRHDLPWIIQQLNRITPLNLFEEFHQQNLEILHLATLLRSQAEGVSQDSSAA